MKSIFANILLICMAIIPTHAESVQLTALKELLPLVQKMNTTLATVIDTASAKASLPLIKKIREDSLAIQIKLDNATELSAADQFDVNQFIREQIMPEIIKEAEYRNRILKGNFAPTEFLQLMKWDKIRTPESGTIPTPATPLTTE